jgi:hypothetical protein
MKFLIIIKNNKVIYKSKYCLETNELKVLISHKRYDKMFQDILEDKYVNYRYIGKEKIELKNNVGTLIYEKEIYEKEKLKGENNFEKIESFLEQFKDIYNFQII